MLRTIDIDLQYQQTIPGPPPREGDLYRKAAAGDKSTIGHWKDTWEKNFKDAKDHFGELGSKSFGQLHGINRHKPAIVIGSGPSLKHSMEALKENRGSPSPVLSISALHNFGYFEDEGCHADYYLSLDSGGVVIDDVSETRNQDGKFYWEKTKGKTLLAYAASDPRLWELWQGDIYLFNTLVPDPEVRKMKDKVEVFTHYISCGGNALGACMYAAKAVMGSSAIMYVGADFAFDYDNTFHSYKTQYDNPGRYITAVDVFGNTRKTWQSYMNFKYWFDHVACNVPGSWVNCSEGLMGAYREGNIQQYEYKSLHDALIPYESADVLFLEEKKANGESLSRTPFNLADFWANPKNDKNVTFF